MINATQSTVVIQLAATTKIVTGTSIQYHEKENI